MNEILFSGTIPLKPVTKKNSMQIARTKSGRPFLIQSKQYRDYAKQVGQFLQREEPITEPCNVEMVFYMPTRRRVDLSNLQSACLDVLVDNGILEDDNCKIVVTHDGSRVIMGDPEPRTIVTITKRGNDIC